MPLFFSLTENSVPLAMVLLGSFQERDVSVYMVGLRHFQKTTKLNPVI